ncbi:MAG: antiterminator LoaP [Blautia sp.]
MWYVVQVCTGTEESIRTQCQKKLSQPVMKDCFIPYYEEKKRYKGEWHTRQRVLFPGYIFAVSDDIEALQEQLKTIIGLTRLLGTGGEITPLTDRERDFLLNLGGEDQIVRMSEGVIENETIRITSGPLKGKEAYIRKIDRHKRKAWLELPMFGRTQRVEAGLEITEKR